MRKATLSLVITDLPETSKLAQFSPDLLETAVRFSQQSSAQLAMKHNGEVIKFASDDSIIICFDVASNAVEMAAEFHRLALSQPWYPSRCVFRSAVVTGDLSVFDDRIEGDDLLTLKALNAEARTGQILIAEATYAIVRQQISESYRFLRLGLHHLEDGRRSQIIYQLLHPDLPNDFQPCPAKLEEVSHLPVGTSRFIGRERQIEDVKDGFLYSRVVNLVGFAGIGKSRLAIQVSRDMIEDHYDGACYINLDGVTQEEDFQRIVSGALGLQASPGLPFERVAVEQLRRNEILIVFDNVNGVPECTAKFVDYLIDLCPRLQALITSRKPLELTNCRRITIGPMAVPDQSARARPEDIALNESATLFTALARRAVPEFDVTPLNADLLAAVCRRLEGIPLAIELAASKMDRLELSEIAAGLKDRFTLLRQSKRSIGHRALETVMGWSYDCLSSDQKMLICRLWVFEGQFTAESATAVAGFDSLEQSEIPRLIEELANQAFVVKTMSREGVFFKLLETVAEFGRGVVIHDGALLTALMERHADYYSKQALNFAERLSCDFEPVVIEELSHSYENFSKLLGWTIGSTSDERWPTILIALSRYWKAKGLFSEGLRWCTAGLTNSRSLRGLMRGRIHMIAGEMAYGLGDWKRADRHFNQAKTIAEKLRDARLLCTGYRMIGKNFHSVFDLPAAKNALCRATELALGLEDQKEMARCSIDLASVLIDLVNDPEATALAQSTLTICTEEQDLEGMAASWFLLGRSARLRGDTDSALDFLNQALDTYYRCKQPQGIAAAVRALALLRVQMDSFHSAAVLFGVEESLRLQNRVFLPHMYLREVAKGVEAARLALGPHFVFEYQKGMDMSEDEIREFLLLNSAQPTR